MDKHSLIYKGSEYKVDAGQTVLDALLSCRQKIRHSCRSGICRSCLLRSEPQFIDESAQKGLSTVMKKSGLFLACQQSLKNGMQVRECEDALNEVEATVSPAGRLSGPVFQVTIEADNKFSSFHPGQFVNIIREDGLCRPYSIAEMTPNKITLHIRTVPQGVMSNWITDEEAAGAKVRVAGPFGECVYLPEYGCYDILMAGTGTGLAPLWGILNEGLRFNHRKKITLIHGAIEPDGLYFDAKLSELAAIHGNFTYMRSVINNDGSPEVFSDIKDAASSVNISPSESLFFACGDPQSVKQLKEAVFLKGVPSDRIFSDPFIGSERSGLNNRNDT